MHLETIAALLNQHIGFDVKIIGDRKIAKAVESRRIACQLSDIDAYLRLLQSSSQEFDQLVECIVVPETWFFRDRKPFDFLVQFVRSEWIIKGAEKLRVLSAPCSTGEEPYSIAIALLEAGLSPQQFKIDAVDISQKALAKAKRAIYGRNSFRGEDWIERQRYFQAVEDKYTVYPIVRNAVDFRQGNVLNAWCTLQPKYDVIFCRNLLIYLENSACQEVLSTLHHLLLPQGLLFVGAAETAKVPSDRFSYLRQAFSFAYRKIDTVSIVQSDAKPKQAVIVPEGSPTSIAESFYFKTKTRDRSSKNHLYSNQAKESKKPSILPINTPIVVPLQQIQQLADAGQIEPAIHQCKTYLESHVVDAEAHVLLGTLYQSIKNNEQAERHFQKALYLQPNCYEALMQLALLKEARGDAIAAERLRQRIQKLQPVPQPNPRIK